MGLFNGLVSVFVRLPAVPPINSSSGWFAAELWRVQQIGLSIDTAGARAAAAGCR